MIGKVVKGRSFKGCISYVLDKEEAKLLDSEGVLSMDTRSIINSFYMQSLMNPALSKSVGHIPLSYHQEDTVRLTDEFMVQLAKEYMEAMDIRNTQYIIVRHNDKAHPHCHIVFNRVDNDGKTISDKNDHFRNEKVTKALKVKHGLYFGKNKDNINRQSLREPEKTKMEIYDAIKTSLKHSKNWNQLEQSLKRQGIELKYKFKGQSNEVQGISFSKGLYSFKGSEIDRAFSYSKLNQMFQHQGHQQTISNQSSQPTVQQPSHPSQSAAASIIEAALEVVGGIDFQPHGEDYEEIAFAKKIRREDNKRRSANRKRGINR